jgi:GNAT superfamily N-acetyltransferase
VHVEKSGEGLGVGWRCEVRAVVSGNPGRKVLSNALGEDVMFVARQIATGADDGIGVVTEYDGQLIALLLAQAEPERGVLRVLDLRVDHDFRRQGIGMAMGFAVLQSAREQELRAVYAETTTDNPVGAEFLLRVGFELSGVDVRRRSNHDLVKEQATLIWYAEV